MSDTAVANGVSELEFNVSKVPQLEDEDEEEEEEEDEEVVIKPIVSVQRSTIRVLPQEGEVEHSSESHYTQHVTEESKQAAPVESVTVKQPQPEIFKQAEPVVEPEQPPAAVEPPKPAPVPVPVPQPVRAPSPEPPKPAPAPVQAPAPAPVHVPAPVQQPTPVQPPAPAPVPIQAVAPPVAPVQQQPKPVPVPVPVQQPRPAPVQQAPVPVQQPVQQFQPQPRPVPIQQAPPQPVQQTPRPQPEPQRPAPKPMAPVTNPGAGEEKVTSRYAPAPPSEPERPPPPTRSAPVAEEWTNPESNPEHEPIKRPVRVGKLGSVWPPPEEEQPEKQVQVVKTKVAGDEAWKTNEETVEVVFTHAPWGGKKQGGRQWPPPEPEKVEVPYKSPVIDLPPVE